tara:strand:+ start:172 stop:516 length:345 start_codon:yes stop_codon:yes gene_type:complete
MELIPASNTPNSVAFIVIIYQYNNMEEINLNNITEQRYLELADQMKDIVGDKDKELIICKKKLAETKKVLLKIYGLISYSSDCLEQVHFDDLDIGVSLCDILNSCCNKIEKNML